MTQRRTIRKYSQQTISPELMKHLLETATRGATCGGMQLYTIINVSSAEMKAKLAPLHFNQPMVMQAPNILTFCVDFNRFSLWAEQRKARPGYDNFLSFLNAMIDTMIVAERFSTACEAEGLGTCYLGTTLYTAADIIALLRLPKLTFPITALTVGYPAECPPLADRLPLEAVVHSEIYQEPSPTDIDRFFAAKEQMPESAKFIMENAKETLAQVFTDIRYPRSVNEQVSKDLLEALKKQEFI